MHFPLRDALGSVRYTASAGGASQDDVDFYPWGTIAGGSYLTSGGHYTFTGDESDLSDSGTYQTRNRQLSASLGRWLRPDPYSGSYDYKNPQSLNRYSYVLNNPLAYIDPDGTTDECVDGCYDASGNSYGGGSQGLQAGNIDTVNVSADDPPPTTDPQPPQFTPQLPPPPAWYLGLNPGMVGQGGTGSTVSAPRKCVSAGVCKSKIDNLNLMEKGKTSYRDPFSICSTHTIVDNSTGATSSHVDLFNPGTSLPTMNGSIPLLPFHLLFDALPDAIYRVTGSYLLPAGRRLCQ